MRLYKHFEMLAHESQYYIIILIIIGLFVSFIPPLNNFKSQRPLKSIGGKNKNLKQNKKNDKNDIKEKLRKLVWIIYIYITILNINININIY